MLNFLQKLTKQRQFLNEFEKGIYGFPFFIISLRYDFFVCDKEITQSENKKSKTLSNFQNPTSLKVDINQKVLEEFYSIISESKKEMYERISKESEAQKKRDNNLGLILSLVGLFGAASAVIDLYNFYHNPDSIAFWWLPYSVIFSFGAYLMWFYKRKK